jgi:hypothetical protein
MEEVATNLAEVSADFVSLWSAEQHPRALREQRGGDEG